MEADALQEGRAIFSIDLHPAYASNALEGLRLQMESRLLRWDAGFGGVLLAYRNLNRLPSEAPIRPYFPYIHIRVAADVLVFKPKKGAVLCGQVTKVGADFIGMTIMGSINAAVGRQNIRSALQYNQQTASWRTAGKPASTVEVGSDVLFTVERLRIDGNGILAVLGAMKEVWTGAAKAAAHRIMAAFPDPVRWQNMEATGIAVRMFEPTADSGHIDAAEAPTVVTPAQIVNTEQPALKSGAVASQPKKKRKSDAGLPPSVEVKAIAKAPEPTLPASEEKPAKKKRKTTQDRQLGNGDVAARDVKGIGDPGGSTEKRKKNTKKAKSAAKDADGKQEDLGAGSGLAEEQKKSGEAESGKGAPAVFEAPGKQLSKKKKKKRRTSEEVQ